MLTGYRLLSSAFAALRGCAQFGAADRSRAGALGEDVRMDSIGGYRLIRRLGSGASAEVWLGSAEASTAAIKVYRAGTPLTRIDAELEALARVSHRHLLRLEDLATAPGGLPCPILQRLSSTSLAGLLARRSLSAGEAVTVVAPLALAVAELHRVGVGHGALGPAAVRFDAEGAPVLARFGSAVVFGELPESQEDASLPPALLAEQEVVARDLAGLAELALAVGGGDEEWRRWLLDPDVRDPERFAHELADRMFALAEPSPVRWEVTTSVRGPGHVPLRLGAERSSAVPSGPGGDIAELPHRPEPEVPSRPEPEPGSLFERLGRLLERGPIAELRSRLAAVLRHVRKPVWVIAGIVAIGVVAFCTVVPPADPAIETTAPPAASPRVEGPGAPGNTVAPDIAGSDPVLAARALLDARAACILDSSVLCLDGVDQTGSAAFDADATLIRNVQEGGTGSGTSELGGDYADAAITVVERLGDSALLSVVPSEGSGSDATLLLIRVDTGWRIRDLVLVDAPVG
jgi:hypothetical protein